LSGLLAAYLVSIPLAMRSYRATRDRTGSLSDADDSPIDVDLDA